MAGILEKGEFFSLQKGDELVKYPKWLKCLVDAAEHPMRQGLEPEAPHGWVSVKAQGGHIVHLNRRNCPKHPGEEMRCFWVSCSNSLPWHIGDAFIEGLDGNLVGILPGHQHLLPVENVSGWEAEKCYPTWPKDPSNAKTSERFL